MFPPMDDESEHFKEEARTTFRRFLFSFGAVLVAAVLFALLFAKCWPAPTFTGP